MTSTSLINQSPLKAEDFSIYVTRKFNFCASHRYYNHKWSEEKNLEVFGKCTNKNSHGHNYDLYVTVTGVLDEETGMVINISDLKRIVGDIVEQFDHKNLNLDTPYFTHQIPTTENLAKLFFELIKANLPEAIILTSVKLYEDSDLYVEYRPTVVEFVRRYRFSASHRLFNNKFSSEENLRIFGKCSNPNGHGHNYYLDVFVKGQIDNDTGMVYDMVKLDRHVADIIQEYDHKHLDLDTDDFKDVPSTTEALSLVLSSKMKVSLGDNFSRLIVSETPKNLFEVNYNN